MKKLFAMLLALTMLASTALAEGNWYVNEGHALSLRMQALAADEVYIGMMTTGDDETRALKADFVQADLSAPTRAWFLPLPDGDEMLAALERLALMEGSEADLNAINELSDVGREELLKKLPSVASMSLCSRAGISWVVLSSLITVSEAKEEPEDFAPGFLLMEYPGDFAVMITFGRPLPGYVTASATPVPAASMEEVSSLLEYAEKLGLSLALEELEIEQAAR